MEVLISNIINMVEWISLVDNLEILVNSSEWISLECSHQWTIFMANMVVVVEKIIITMTIMVKKDMSTKEEKEKKRKKNKFNRKLLKRISKDLTKRKVKHKKKSYWKIPKI